MTENIIKFVKGGEYRLYRQNGDEAVRSLKVLARSVNGDALKVSYGNNSSIKIVHLRISEYHSCEMFVLPQYLTVMAIDYLCSGNKVMKLCSSENSSTDNV